MNTTISKSAFGRSAFAPSYKATSILERVRHTVLVSLERFEQRLALSELDDRLLKDIGVTPTDQVREVGKPFWAN
jgi:uncharacterized protein YjiS (DUF1127 family)